MILRNSLSKKKFTISDDDLEYLFKILSYDMENNHTEHFLYNNDISLLISWDISNFIDFLLNSGKIYEFIRKDKIIPIIDPNMKELGYDFVVSPISNDKHHFLFSLSKFLKQTGEVQITR